MTAPAAPAAVPRSLLGFGLALAAIVFVADQAVKYWVLEVLRFSPEGCLEQGIGCRRIEISGIFDLTMVWNFGVSFGLFQAEQDWMRWLLVAISAGISAMFLWWLRTADRWLSAVALGLVIGGAIGNLVDRVRFGAVADFFDFSGLGFPYVFNIADAAITVGAALLILAFLTEPKPDAPKT
jgi:signal peptidase II